MSIRWFLHRFGREGNIPIEFHIEAGDGELEGVQVFEGIECEAADCGCVCQCAEEFGERVRDVFLGAAAVDCDGHVLLRIAEERKICSAVGWKTD